MFPQLLEDPPDGLFMFFDRVGEYEYIIQVYMYGSPDLFAKYSRHKSLERRGGIAVPLLHYITIKCTVHGFECHFFHMCRVYLHLFLCVGHIQL